MPKSYINESDRHAAQLSRRMDRFDSLVVEYLRSSGYTISDLAYELGIDPSTLWRYRKQEKSFELAPFVIVTRVCQLAKCSTETLRYICGMGGAV